MQRRLARVSVVAALGFFGLAGCSTAPEIGVNVGAIVGGTNDTGDPAVVLLIAQKPGSQFASLCTAEVISPHVLLTAAHCVSPSVVGTGAQFQAFLGTNINDQSQSVAKNFVDIKSVDFDPAFNVNTLENGHDIGVAISATAFTITPIPVNQAPMDDADVGASFRLVGYGEISTLKADASSSGIKRQVTSQVKQVTDTLLAYGDATHNTCEGDSGGPGFLTRNGVEVIAGVTSYGDQNCMLGGVDTRVDAYWESFIKPHILAADGTATSPDMAMPISGADAGTQSGIIPANGSVAIAGTCTDSVQCASGLCTQGDHRYCTAACVLNPPTGTAQICPAGTHCGEVGTSPFCVLDSGGCSAAAGAGGARGAHGALPAGLLLLLASLGRYARGRTHRDRTLARRRVE